MPRPFQSNRIKNYPSDIADWLTLPASGNPLSFKDYVSYYKNNYVYNVKLDSSKSVYNFCYYLEMGMPIYEYKLNKFNNSELDLYFSYLSSLYYQKNPKLKLHGDWIAKNMSFEELYEIVDKGIEIEITYKDIIYKGCIWGDTVINFFQ